MQYQALNKVPLSKLMHRLRKAEAEGVSSTQELVSLFQFVLENLPTGPRNGGLLLLIDELGKLLEFAAANPKSSDIYLLQSLAEFAVRASKPFQIVAILHQDFSAYASRLSAEERAEWDKIRGRFEDVAFEEPADEMLRLVAHAMAERQVQPKTGRGKQSGRDGRNSEFASLCRRAFNLHLAPANINKEEFTSLLMQCHPLHPLVTLIIGHVFRRFAQNERSVFSFLASLEPYGLQEFVDQNGTGRTLYRADRLYDYLVHALGDSLYGHHNGRRWAEVDHALSRYPQGNGAEIALLKTIGLLSAIGPVRHVVPTQDVLRFAVDGLEDDSSVRRSLAALKQASVIVPRKYSNSFAIWEGSDVDIEERLKEARSRLNPSSSTASLASQFLSPRPLVARRHSFKTGTLRHFTVRFASPLDLADPQEPSVEADGSLLVVLADDREQERQAETLAATTFAERTDVLFVQPGNTRIFAEMVREAAALEWVKGNIPELEGDATARRELRTRISDVQKRLDVLLSEVLFPLQTKSSTTKYFHKGTPQPLCSYRELNDYLSTICDTLYEYTPRIHNELLNRKELSSSAAAARRDLIEAMITRSGEPDLGIPGTPPAKSMYLSLLHTSGIHCRREGRYGFHRPSKASDRGIRAVWTTIERYLRTSVTSPGSVSSLFEILQAKPYGLRAGPLPVLLCAALLVNDADVALYEQGSFVPNLTVAVFERLMKAPQQFMVQRWQVGGVRSAVFQKLSSMLGRNNIAPQASKADVLGIVRPLCKFATRLNEFTRQTREVDQKAQAIRAALLGARQPDQLLFVELPQACGIKPFAGSLSKGRESDAVSFIEELEDGLGQLQRCYPRLLSSTRTTIAEAFRIRSSANLRDDLVVRATTLREWAIQPALKMLVGRALDSSLDEDPWLESLITAICDKAPAFWRDSDIAAFDIALTNVSRRFLHLETLMYSRSPSAIEHDGRESVRIGITARDSDEIEHVIHVAKHDLTRVAALEQSILRTLGSTNVNGDNLLAVAALARVARQLLSPEQGTSAE